MGIFLHHIHTDEDKNVYHNHPWDGVSFIFGSYREFKVDGSCADRRWFNYLRATDHHRIELPYGPVWTLFIHGKRYNTWTVIDGLGNLIKTEPWRGIGGTTSYSQG